MNDGLVQFLRSRYEEERAAEEGRRTVRNDVAVEWTHYYDFSGEYVQIDGGPRLSPEEFYDRFGEPAVDPTVLADIDAKLALLDEHLDVNEGSCGTCVDGHWGYPTHGGSSPQSYPCRTLRLVGALYARHPDYRAEWRAGEDPS